MGARSERKTIAGRNYVVTQMPPTLAFPLQVRIFQIVGAVAGPLIKEISDAGAANITQEVVGRALASVSEAIINHLPPDKCLEFAKQLANPEYVSVDGVPICFETEFMGDDMVNLYPAMAFVLEVNYAQFFNASVLGRLVGLVKDKFPSQPSSESPQT